MKNTPPISSLRIRTGGFSLVEVMIAITLGLLLTAAVLQLFVGNSATFRTTDAISRVQENARYAQSVLNQELRMVGYRGCLSKQTIAITNTLNNSSTLAYNFALGLRGYNDLPTSLPSELSDLLADDPAPLAGSDLLLVQGPTGPSIPIVANNNAAQLFASADAATELTTGDIALVTDCSKARVFQITNLTAAANRTNVVHSNSGAFVPGNAISSWDPNDKNQIFGPGSELMSYRSSTYYLAITPDRGTPALFHKINSQEAEVLLDEVYALQILYGVDTNGDRQTDLYQNAAAITDWSRVLTIRLQLILGSEEAGVVPQPQSLSFNGSTFTAPDTRWYMSSVVTAVLRNRLN